MSLFAPGTDITAPKTLEELLNEAANSETGKVKDQYASLRKRAVAGQAASGRLSSGVSDYPLTELDKSEGSAIAGIHGDLAKALGGYGADNYFKDKEHTSSLELAKLIGDMNKKSELEQILGGLGGLGGLAGGIAGFF